MARWLGILLGIALLALGFMFMRTYFVVQLPWNKPETEEVRIADVLVPISAAGLIEPHQRIEIKSEASGEVARIPVVEGDRVSKGAVLIELDPEDEQRAVDRAQAAVDRAQALLAQARESVKRGEANLLVQRARVKELETQLDLANYRLAVAEAEGEQYRSEDELKALRSNQGVLQYQLEAGRAQVDVFRANIEEAKANVDIQQASLREAQKNLEDAQQRMAETTIKSQYDAIVTDVAVKVGTLVQSGTGSFTGGTVLLTLADVSGLKVVTRVDEADYGRIRDIAPVDSLPDIEGLREFAQRDAEQLKERSGTVKVTVDAFPEEEFVGRIELVEPQGKLNPGASIIQFDVHVAITDEQKFLLPLGAQAQVEFTVESSEDALVVPSEAVKVEGGERGVFKRVTAPAGAQVQYIPEFVRCRFGLTDGAITEVVEVLDGKELNEGDTVYTKLPPKPREEP